MEKHGKETAMTKWKHNYKLKITNQSNERKGLTKEEVNAWRSGLLKQEHDLVGILPVLRKYSLEGEALTKVKNLRSNKKTTKYEVKLDRITNLYDVVSEKFTTHTKGEYEYNVLSERRAKPFIIKTKTTHDLVDKPFNSTSILSLMRRDIVSQIKVRRNERQPKPQEVDVYEGVKVPKFDNIYVNKGTFLLIKKRKERAFILNGESVKPSTSDPYVGVELEFISKHDKHFIADKLWEANLSKIVRLVEDGSLRGEDKYPHTHELRIISKQSDIYENVTKICHVLNTHCAVSVNTTCGMHVHLDMRQKNEEAMHTAYGNLVSIQHFMFASLAASRLNARFCKINTNKKFSLSDDRYRAINTDAYKRHKTLEIRAHSGTTDAVKINNWVALLLAASNASEIKKAGSSFIWLQEKLGLSDDLIKYFKERTKKFAKIHKETGWNVLLLDVEPVEETVGVADVSEERSEL